MYFNPQSQVLTPPEMSLNKEEAIASIPILTIDIRKSGLGSLNTGDRSYCLKQEKISARYKS
jgi:hypothetical protein